VQLLDETASEESGISGRSLLAGLALGALLTIANVYMGLKTGWWDPGTITAAVVGYAMVAPGARTRGRPYSLRENNVTLTAAAAAGGMPASLGLLGAIPALEILGHRYSAWKIAAWGAALSLVGLLLGVPLRRRLVVRAELPFPSARATAEVVRAVHSTSSRALAQTRGLLAAAAVAAVVTWLRDGRPSLLPANLWWPWRVAGLAPQVLGIGLAMSPMLLGAGAMMGPRVGTSLALGAFVGWVLLAPPLIRAGLCAADFASLVGWLMWPGVGLMLVGGLAAFVPGRNVEKADQRDSAAFGTGTARRGRRAWWALAASAAAAVLLSWRIFHLPVGVGLIAMLGAMVLIHVCVRTYGETDMAPLGSLGQLVQLVMALLAPGAGPANVAAASFTAGAGAQAALSVSGFKIGRLLGAPFAGQFRAHLVGLGVGLLVAMPTYALLTGVYSLGGPGLPAPGAAGWQAVAAVAELGAGAIPRGALWGCGAGAVAGAVCAVLERRRPSWWMVPSPAALGVALLVPAVTSFSAALGAVLWLVARRAIQRADEVGPAISAGAIAGESLVGLLVAVLLALGQLS
jgi:uncharacterized oligopeptide transporter (OPT) family protein